MAELFQPTLRQHGDGPVFRYSLEIILPRKIEAEHVQRVRGLVEAAVSQARESLKPPELALGKPSPPHLPSIQAFSKETHALQHDLGRLPPANAQRLAEAVDRQLGHDREYAALREEYDGRARLADAITQVEAALSQQGIRMWQPTLHWEPRPFVSLGHPSWLDAVEVRQLQSLLTHAIWEALRLHGQQELALGDRPLEMETIETRLREGSRLRTGFKVILPSEAYEQGEAGMHWFLKRLEHRLYHTPEFTGMQQAYYKKKRELF